MAVATLRAAPGVLVRPALAVPPHLRARVLAVLGAAVLLVAGYYGWLRDSSLVSVERVTVTGLTTGEAPKVRAALAAAARDMTTLHVRTDELEDSVASYGVVQAIEVETDFPHGLRIRVIQQRPAAVVPTDDGRIAVAGDGTVLKELPLTRGLPVIDLPRVDLHGERLTHARALQAVAVLGAAPRALHARIASAGYDRRHGLVVELRRGPDIYFGDASRLRAKWAAAARVMATGSASGATYVDVRLPERPAAGGLAAKTVEPVGPPAEPEPATAEGAAPATPNPQGAGAPEPAPGTAPPAQTAPPAAPAPTAPAPTTTPQTNPQP